MVPGAKFFSCYSCMHTFVNSLKLLIKYNLSFVQEDTKPNSEDSHDKMAKACQDLDLEICIM